MINLRFYVKLFLFGLPFLILIVCTWLITRFVGDGLSFDEVIARQMSGEVVLYQPPWQRADSLNYKVLALTHYKPDIAVVGSSRAQLVYSDIFNLRPDAFYNTNVSSLEMADMNLMVQYWASKDALPRYLFLEIDFPRLLAPIRESIAEDVSLGPLYDMNFAFRRTLDTLSNSFYKPRDLLRTLERARLYPHILGSSALVDLSSGLRRDGSIYFSDISIGLDSRLQSDSVLFQNRQSLFRTGNTLDEDTFAYFQAILEAAHSRGTTVIGYIPPIRASFYEKMRASDEFAYIDMGIDRLNQYFVSYNMPLFDFREMESFDGRDDELYDAWHPGILANARMYYVMLSQLPELAAYVDLDELHQDIRNSPDNFYPFGRDP